MTTSDDRRDDGRPSRLDEDPDNSAIKEELDRIEREARATERFLETGRYTDYLLEKEEDPNSKKAIFIRGFQQGCPLGALSVVAIVGVVAALALRVLA